MSYTPGPWKISEHNDYIYSADTPGKDIFRLDWICQFFYKTEDDMPNREANARLIVAAPDLLVACETALDALGCDRTRIDRLEAQRIIHAAIKKARR